MSSTVFVMGGLFLITPRPLLPAVLLGKDGTLGTEQLHHCCHREHLVIASRAQPPAGFTERSASPATRLCLCTSLLETLDMLNTPTRPRPSLLHATSPSENSCRRTMKPPRTRLMPANETLMLWTQRTSSLRTDVWARVSVFAPYGIRSCLSSSTWLFPKAPGSKCVDYSGIHLYNACDNGIKQLPWEKSVWRMDYAKALPMGRWTQELSQAVSISSGCIASENCSDAAFRVRALFSGEKTGDGEATVVYVLVSNYHRSTRKRRRYSTSISNLHLLYIRSVCMARIYLLFSRPWYRNPLN